MEFSMEEKQVLLSVRGVGPTVIQRLEQLGIFTLDQLSKADALDVVTQAAALVGSSCWRNSPQARSAIQAAIAKAREVEGCVD